MKNRIKLWAPLALAALAGCGSAPPIVTDPPRLAAVELRDWPAGAPGRQAEFSDDGALLATSTTAGQVILRRTLDWKPVRRIEHPGGATSLAFTPDGKRILTAGYDGVIRAWDLATGKPAGDYRGAAGTIWSIDISPDGRRVAAAGEDAVIRLWELDGTAPPIALRGHQRNIWEVRFSPDGNKLASAGFDHSVRLWDAAGGKPLKVLSGHGQAVVGLDFSPDGRTLATSGDDSTIRLWRASDGAALRTINAGNHAYKPAFSPDGRWLASAGRARSAIGTFWYQLTGSGGAATPVRLWRVADGAAVAALPHPDDVMFASFSPDGRYLVTSGEDQRVRIWRLSER